MKRKLFLLFLMLGCSLSMSARATEFIHATLAEVRPDALQGGGGVIIRAAGTNSISGLGDCTRPTTSQRLFYLHNDHPMYEAYFAVLSLAAQLSAPVTLIGSGTCFQFTGSYTESLEGLSFVALAPGQVINARPPSSN